jgi:glycosyltransferase involved in cell wall biosynthesis
MLRISVIIPAYNRANYLPEALDSVFVQRPAPNEIIVVDDGSTDDTLEVMRGYEGRVRYARQEHQGVSAARNCGLALAQGDVIAWLDADDVWEPGFLATVLPILDTDPEVAGVYTGLTRIDPAGNRLPQVGQTVVPAEELYSSLVDDCFIQTSTFVARKRCFDQIGGFDSRFDICEDYDMFLRLAQRCRIVGIPELLVRYRVHPHNTVSNTEAFCRFRLALTEKHFGKPEGDPQAWPPTTRRAHGHAFRAAAYKCIQGGQMDQGWAYLEKAFVIWPPLLTRLDTFYELACGDQPTGRRGDVTTLDIDSNGAQMVSRLDGLFAKNKADIAQMRGPAYGNAYLALAILSDQAGRWSVARGYLFRAIEAHPRLLTSTPVLRRLLKLSAGQRLVGFGRSLGGGQQPTPHTTHPGGAHDESPTSH